MEGKIFSFPEFIPSAVTNSLFGSIVSRRSNNESLRGRKKPGGSALARRHSISVVMALIAIPVASAAVQIRVSPTSATISAGAVQTFTAKVTGPSNTILNWSVPSGIGAIQTINGSGVYYAPSTVSSPTSVMIVAKTASGATGTATVTVVGGGSSGSGSSVSVSVSPTSIAIATTGKQQFTATV